MLRLRSFVFPSLVLAAGSFSLWSVSPQSYFWSDNSWTVKQSILPVGPGPNIFRSDTIGKTGSGSLEMTIKPKRRRWSCAELYSEDYYSYGRFTLTFRIDGELDRNAVFGFFLYNEKEEPRFNEIDFEMARWGIAASPNVHFSIQPYETAGNSLSISTIGSGTFTAEILWTAEQIRIRLLDGGGGEIKTFDYKGDDIPRRTESRVHFNLWLFGGNNPAGDGALKVELKDFSYSPYQ